MILQGLSRLVRRGKTLVSKKVCGNKNKSVTWIVIRAVTLVSLLFNERNSLSVKVLEPTWVSQSQYPFKVMVYHPPPGPDGQQPLTPFHRPTTVNSRP